MCAVRRGGGRGAWSAPQRDKNGFEIAVAIRRTDTGHTTVTDTIADRPYFDTHAITHHDLPSPRRTVVAQVAHATTPHVLPESVRLPAHPALPNEPHKKKEERRRKRKKKKRKRRRREADEETTKNKKLLRSTYKRPKSSRKHLLQIQHLLKGFIPLVSGVSPAKTK